MINATLLIVLANGVPVGTFSDTGSGYKLATACAIRHQGHVWEVSPGAASVRVFNANRDADHWLDASQVK